MHAVFRWSTSAGRGPGKAGLGGGAGAGLEACTVSTFSVMAEPTSAWAWGGHMDPKDGMLTCGREQSYWDGQRPCFSHVFNLSEHFSMKAP